MESMEKAVTESREKSENSEDNVVDCYVSVDGTCAGTEAAFVVNIFLCSVETRKFRYTYYLGDGDSSSYKKVVNSKPYGEKPIEKLECVGHDQKKCGTRLRQLVNENKGQKLDDGKGISGQAD
ncbi:forkhead box protein k1 [Biomphalaria glabrata]|nr:CAunnamed protein product [Biomphalaria glabrata]